MVLNIDLAPTVLSAAGLPVPNGMQGRDLAPLYLAEEPPVWREDFLYEHPTITNKTRWKGLGSEQCPRAVFVRVFTKMRLSFQRVVLAQATFKIVCVTDI